MIQLKKILWSLTVIGAVASSLSLLILAGIIGYWHFFPSVPLIVYSEKFLVMNPDKKVCTGSNMIYATDFEKKYEVQCRIARQLVDNTVITYTVTEPPIKEQKRMRENYEIYVPKNAETGHWWYMRWTADCDGLNIVDNPAPVSRVTEKFLVVDCGGKK
jgi:hypothetical protein